MVLFEDLPEASLRLPLLEHFAEGLKPIETQTGDARDRLIDLVV